MPDVAYFFFVANSRTKESIDHMLSSFLLQLATHQERHKILCESYEADKNAGHPSRSSLCQYLTKLLAVSGKVILIIDALDEHPIPRDGLLQFLTDLIHDHHDHLLLLVISRKESDIEVAMKRITVTEVDLVQQSEQKEDIQKYITGVLQTDEPFRTWADSHPDILCLIKDKLLQERM